MEPHEYHAIAAGRDLQPVFITDHDNDRVPRTGEGSGNFGRALCLPGSDGRPSLDKSGPLLHPRDDLLPSGTPAAVSGLDATYRSWLYHV